MLKILERAAEAKHKQLATADEEARFVLLLQKILAEVTSKPQIKGDKGDAPVKGVDYFTAAEVDEFLTLITPVLGVDYFTAQEKADLLREITPVKGVHYDDGKPGPPGPPGKGKKGDPGPAGKVDTDEVQSITKRAILEHETEFDHSLIHDPSVVGTRTVDETSIADGKILQVKGKTLVYVEMPKAVRGRRDWFPSDGVGLPGQAGNSGKVLTTDGTTASWTASSSTVNFADAEIPVEAVDGVNTTFTFLHTPTAGSAKIFLGGIRMITGYTIVGSTYVFDVAPEENTDLCSDYRY